MKTAVCLISKFEHLYLIEWVEHYKTLGFNNILFYDNNPENDLSQYNILLPYINDGFVIYHDIKGISNTDIQKKSYNEALKNYYNMYDWIAYFDADEFLDLGEFNTIKDFLNSNENFKNYMGIYIPWELYDDNDHLYYENKPLKERFTRVAKHNNNTITRADIKCILNTKIYYIDPNITFNSPHTLFIINDKYKACNVLGENIECFVITPSTKIVAARKMPIINGIKLKHYRFKSISEYLIKIDKGDCNFRGYKKKINDKPILNENILKHNRIEYMINTFKAYNSLTDEKKMIINDFFKDDIV